MKIQHLRNGVILISIGLVFLFNNLGYVDWEVWETIISWWPVYLIALGIEIVFRNSKLKLIALISPITFAFFILGPAWWQWEGKEEDRLVQKTEWSQTISSGTNLLQADLDFRLGQLVVSLAPEKGVKCNLEYQGQEPYLDFSEAKGSAKLRIEDHSQKAFGISSGSFGVKHSGFREWEDKNWEVQFDSFTPLELKLSSQVSKNNLDLSNLKLRKLDLSLQVAKAVVKLGEKSDTVIVKLDEEVSKLDLWVPREAVVELDRQTDLAALSNSNVAVVKKIISQPEGPLPEGEPVIFLSYQGALCKLHIRGY